MAANTSPIYSVTPHVDSIANNTSGLVAGPTANTAQDGSGSAIYKAFQAGANGSYLQKMVFRAVGSPAATVARVYICTATGGTFTAGTTNTTTNTMLYSEVSLPAVTLSQTTQSPTLEINFGFAINPSYQLLVSFGTSTGSSGTGYSVVAIGGDY